MEKKPGYSGGVRGKTLKDGEQQAQVFLESEKRALLERRISELGLSIHGTVVQQLVEKLYAELADKGLLFKPPVYLSDEWGCPEATPLIGVPFYLADPRLIRIEEEVAVEVEGELDIMRYLRHEAGHAFNYAYRLYDRPKWKELFGAYSRPYKAHFRVDPFSRNYVRHIHGWYAQKHPDEDFAETFAVWLTPGSDWSRNYEGWPVLAKLELVDRVMHEVADQLPEVPAPSPEDLPVDAMHETVAEHYKSIEPALPIEDVHHFDRDLSLIFGVAGSGRDKDEKAQEFLRRYRREIVRRVAYWTGESTILVRAFIDLLIARAAALNLTVGAPQADALIDLTSFAVAVIMNYRYTNDFDG